MIKCAECQCALQDCKEIDTQNCTICTKDVCCCVQIHYNPVHSPPKKNNMKPLTVMHINDDEDCCAHSVCSRNNSFISKRMEGLLPRSSSSSSSASLSEFFRRVKGLYAAALGIEILCIAAAELGENTGLYFFGFNLVGIPIAYAMGYALAGFTTFATILGRYNYCGSTRKKIDSCCSVLEQGGASSGFLSNLRATFRNFAVGIGMIPQLYRQPNLNYIMKTSLYILITAESACILTAETVDLIFYQYSILLSIPLALLAGAFAVVAPEAYRKIKHKTK
jgi:hypothetical protein